MKRRLHLASASLLVVFWLGNSAPAAATHAQDLAASETKLSNAVRHLGSLVSARGDVPLRALYNQTRFVIPSGVFPNASVMRKGDGITVTVAAEYHLLLTYLADTIIVSGTNFAKCHIAYQWYVTSTLPKLQNINGKAMRILAPEEFAASRPDHCEGFASLFPIPLVFVPRRDEQIETAIIVMLLHELGHVALNHSAVDYRALPSNTSIGMAKYLALSKRSREQEDAADNWAAERSVMLGIAPREIVTPVFISAYIAFTGTDCSLERAGSHSNGVARAERIFLRYFALKEKNGTVIDPKIKEMVSEFIAIAKRARVGMYCEPSPGG